MWKSHKKTKNLNYQVQHGMKNGSCSVSDIQGYFECIVKELGEKTDNLSIKIYVNKIENRIGFKIKRGYHLELLTPETMKLLGSNKSKKTKDKNGENMPNLEITELALVHCNIVNNNYQYDSGVLYIFISYK